jgi:hypothetical protein
MTRQAGLEELGVERVVAFRRSRNLEFARDGWIRLIETLKEAA